MSRRGGSPADGHRSGDGHRPDPGVDRTGDAVADWLAEVDPVSFARCLAKVGAALGRHPRDVAPVLLRWSRLVTRANFAAAATALGASTAGPLAPDAKDHRFDDAAWQENAAFLLLEQLYLIAAQTTRELVNEADVDAHTRAKAAFAVGVIIDAVAPTNALFTNPAALHRAFQTGGRSMLRGFRNLLQDMASNGGKPRQVDMSAFQMGRDLAATPGQVVYRNDLMELIQYAPQTDTVFETPLLASPPWINKYYIMDLAPGRSFIEWAVTHGHTTFAISYRNPDGSMRNVTLDDYLLGGPLAALDVIADITGADQANIAGLCLGGTLATMLLAWLAHDGGERVRSVTLFNTLIDFSEPGVLGVFTDESSLAALSRKLRTRGYLDGKEMAGTFDFLRPNDLVWNYVTSNWLMGDDPPAFDILAWNSDSTRLPEAMLLSYLRSCYLENALAHGNMELAGRALRLDDIGTDTYMVSAQQDHIAPWRGAYRATRLLKSHVRFVLSSSGHIAGIVNPPGGKARHWVNQELPATPDEWLAGATCHNETWWQDWADWVEPRAGKRKRQPPPMGSPRHPPVADAPGRYVLEK